MRNRMTNSFGDTQPNIGDAEDGFQPDHRLVWLFAAMLLPMLVIAVRLFWLQTVIPDRFLAEFRRTVIDYESIAARDGRIVAQSSVLAYDKEQYEVHAHYRWLEEPANDAWLRRHVRAELRKASSEPVDPAAARQRVLERRDSMWAELARLANVPPAELALQREETQTRVERIIESVNRRHRERNSQAGEPSQQNEATIPGWFAKLQKAVTTNPRQRHDERIIVLEELDYHQILADVPLKLAAQIQAAPERFPGLRVQLTSRRHYPAGSLAAHIVGTRTQMRSKDKDADSFEADGNAVADLPDSRVGRTGVELAYDERLRGIPGLRKITRNRSGEIVDTEVIREPQSGQDVSLTIDPRLQARAEELLEVALQTPVEDEASGASHLPQGGCVLVLDVHTGSIRAAASAPQSDLNLLADGDARRWQQALGDPRRPLLSRITQVALPPGSVFKPLTAIAAVESGIANPRGHFACQGYLDHPRSHRCLLFRHTGHGHGHVDLASALAQSCNVYFFSAARHAGANALLNWTDRFGFGNPTGIDLPFERSGNVPSLGRGRIAGPTRRNNTELLGMSIGQSRLLVTPLQIVRMMAAIANGGFLITPHITGDDGPTIVGSTDSTQTRVLKRERIPDLQEATLREIHRGLVAAVDSPLGTGYQSVRLAEVQIAGKSGTAEVGGNLADHAWFAGYVPANRPRFAFVAVIEHGGSGATMAGPVARECVQAMLDLHLIEPASIARTAKAD